jgi:hypothetical protein
MDTDLDLFSQTLDHDHGHRGLLEFFIDILADLEIFPDILGKISAFSEPQAAPILGITEPQC